MSNERKPQIPPHVRVAFLNSSKNFFEQNRKLGEDLRASRKAYEAEDELYFNQQKSKGNIHELKSQK